MADSWTTRDMGRDVAYRAYIGSGERYRSDNKLVTEIRKVQLCEFGVDGRAGLLKVRPYDVDGSSLGDIKTIYLDKNSRKPNRSHFREAGDWCFE